MAAFLLQHVEKSRFQLEEYSLKGLERILLTDKKKDDEKEFG
jgi:hypothetical protein